MTHSLFCGCLYTTHKFISDLILRFKAALSSYVLKYTIYINIVSIKYFVFDGH
jgi:hypothetical protein